MESEDDFDWEEVPVPEHEQHFEITLQANPNAESPSKKKYTGISYAERLLRIDCHKIHTIALLANARARNKWLNDELLHARLLSLTPMHLQNAFAMIHKSRVPDQNQRGRMFEAAVRSLTEWWTSSFFEVLLEGHIRNRTFDDVRSRLTANGIVPPPSASSGDTPTSSASPLDQLTILKFFINSQLAFPDAESLMDIMDDEGETIKSPNSLMKHALMRCGSRDTSAQLFTALCRALGIPARLVVSLQSMPWQSSVGKPKPKYRKKVQKDEEKQANGLEEEEEMEEINIPIEDSTYIPSASKGKGKAIVDQDSDLFPNASHGPGDQVQPKSAKAKGKEKAKPLVKLRKQKHKVRRPNNPGPSVEPPDPLLTPPVFWTEVFSRPDSRWLPVDPIRSIVNKRKVFDPTAMTSGASMAHRSGTRRENRMMYVLAFEEDSYARDVTRRYAREYNAKVAKAQAGGGGKGRQLWWEMVVGLIARPYRLHRDDIEDEELDTAQLMEGMPTTMTGFKNHPLYVLERHLKQNEIINPPPPDTSEVGKFRGEPVYPRSAVVTLKTAETWMRTEGRTIKPGSQPLKMVKLHASTVGKMREVETLREAGTTERDAKKNEVMQGLYARFQTEPFVPDPVANGIVPKNNFGNIDLYVPSMLPKGAAHIPFKGVAKIARNLGFDYAEAVTGFEFKKRRAFPIIEGIVVAQENETTLLEAYWEAERISEEKAQAKRENQVIKRWTRLIQGLRIRQRLQNQYANKSDDSQRQKQSSKKPSSVPTNNEEKTESETLLPGGFLVQADDVVHAFTLPKYQHANLPFNPGSNTGQRRQTVNDDDKDDQHLTAPEYVTYDIHTMEVDSEDTENHPPLPAPSTTAPMTMQELAEAAAKKHSADQDVASLGAEDGKADTVIDTHNNTRALRSRKDVHRSTPLPAKLEKSTAPGTKVRGTAKPWTRASRKRRLARNDDDDDSHIDSDEPTLDSESDHAEEDDQPSPKKRVRTPANSASAPAPSTRVLRPRKNKIQA